MTSLHEFLRILVVWTAIRKLYYRLKIGRNAPGFAENYP